MGDITGSRSRKDNRRLLMDTATIVYLSVLILVVPGFLLNWASGLKVPWALAGALPVSFGLFGLAAWLLGLTPWRYDVATVTVLWVLLLVLALAWRGGCAWWRRRHAVVAPERSARGWPATTSLNTAAQAASAGAPATAKAPPVAVFPAARPKPGRPVAAPEAPAAVLAAVVFVDPQADILNNAADLAAATGLAAATRGRRHAGLLESVRAVESVKGAADAQPEVVAAVAAPRTIEPATATALADAHDAEQAGGAAARAKRWLRGALGLDGTAGWRFWQDPQRRAGSVADPVWAIPGIGVIIGAWAIIAQSFSFLEETPDKLDNIFQGWDVQWHANVVRFILEEGIASPTRMGELHNIETHNSMYYPSGWHAGVYFIAELLGVSPVEAVNVASIVVPGLGLPLSVGLLAWKMMRSRGMTTQLGAALGALMIPGAPAVYWVGSYVGAWPYVAAIAVTGIVTAMFMTVPYRPSFIFAAAMALMGMTQMHPSSATVVVGALLLWWLLYLVFAPSTAPSGLRAAIRVRLHDVAVLAVAGIIGVLILLPQLLVGSEVTEEVAAFSGQEDVTAGEAWMKALTMNTRHVDSFGDFDLRWVLWAAAIGGIVLIFWRRNLWAPLFYLFSLAVTANALTPLGDPWTDWLGFIGGLHYSMAHRLVMPVGMYCFAAAGVGIAVLIRLVTLGPVTRWRRWTTLASILLAIPVAWGVYVHQTDEIHRGARWAITASRFDDRMVSAYDRKAFDWLAKQPHAFDGMIMGEPADGHGWMYAYNGLPSVMRHYDWPSDDRESDTRLLYWWGNALGAGNPGAPNERNHVDEAAERMHVKYYYLSPGNFWPAQEYNARINDGLWVTPGVTAVYADHNVTIFAVNDAFTDAELTAMRESGDSPDPLDERNPVRTKAQAGVATGADDADEPYYHRPTEPNNYKGEHELGPEDDPEKARSPFKDADGDGYDDFTGQKIPTL